MIWFSLLKDPPGCGGRRRGKVETGRPVRSRQKVVAAWSGLSLAESQRSGMTTYSEGSLQDLVTDTSTSGFLHLTNRMRFQKMLSHCPNSNPISAEGGNTGRRTWESAM